MMCIERLQEYLHEKQVPYQVQHHTRAFTAQDVAASEHLPGEQLAKVVMMVADEKLVMLVLPAPERVYMPQVAHVLGTKNVRLAEETEFAYRFLDCEVGAMPPFGNLYGVPVYVDALLAAEDEIFFQVGTHTETMSVKYDDFARVVKPVVASFSLQGELAYSR